MRADGNFDSLALVRSYRAAILVDVVSARGAPLSFGNIHLSAKRHQRFGIDVGTELVIDVKRARAGAGRLGGRREQEPITIEVAASRRKFEVNRSHRLRCTPEINLIIQLLANFKRKI